MPLSSKWYEECKTKEDKEKKEKFVRAAKPVFDELTQHIEDMIARKERSRVVDYENPSWAYLQADNLGAIRAYKEVIALITIDQKE